MCVFVCISVLKAQAFSFLKTTPPKRQKAADTHTWQSQGHTAEADVSEIKTAGVCVCVLKGKGLTCVC